MISQTLFAVSDNESRPIHTGSLFEVDSEGLTICRWTLPPGPPPRVHRQEGGSGDLLLRSAGAALSEVEKICSDVDEPASVTQAPAT